MKTNVFFSLRLLAASFFSLVLSLSFQNLSAADYYWVGGSGNWSDFSNHWATSSGGSTYHAIPPSQNDDVYFDQNSFSASGQTVMLDVSFCYFRNIDWTGVLHNPTWAGDSEINAYGSLIFSPNMQLAFSPSYTMDFNLRASTNGHIIHTFGHSFSNANHGISLNFIGQGGGWTLESDVYLGDMDINISLFKAHYGSLNTNGYSITSYHFDLFSTTVDRVDLDTSTIYCRNFLLQGSDSTVVDADSSTIYARFLTSNAVTTFHDAFIEQGLSNGALGKWIRFDRVEMVSTIATDQDIGGNIVYNDYLYIGDPGRTINVNGHQLFMNQFNINSQPGFPVRILGNSVFEKASGIMCYEWLYLQNSDAIGGATWYAGWQSSDLGNNTGWIFATSDSCQDLVSTSAPRPGIMASWFPNPATGSDGDALMQLRFDLSSPGNVSVEIRDFQGRLIYAKNQSANSGEHQWVLPLDNLAAGSYLGIIETPDGRRQELLIVE